MKQHPIPEELVPAITICVAETEHSDKTGFSGVPILYGHSSPENPIKISPAFIVGATNALYAFMLHMMPESEQNKFIEYCRAANKAIWSDENIGEKLLTYSTHGRTVQDALDKLSDIDEDFE